MRRSSTAATVAAIPCRLQQNLTVIQPILTVEMFNLIYLTFCVSDKEYSQLSLESDFTFIKGTFYYCCTTSMFTFPDLFRPQS